MFALALSLIAAAPAEKVDLYDVPEAAFVLQARADLAVLKRDHQALVDLEAALDAMGNVFTRSEAQGFNFDERAALMSTWSTFFDRSMELEQLRQRYWDFVKHRPGTLRHAWGYLMTHGALTALLAHGLAFTDRAAGRKPVEVLFDEPAPQYGVPRGAFASFKEQVVDFSTTSQLLTGDAWAPAARKLSKRLGLDKDQDASWLSGAIKDWSASAKKRLKKRGVQLYARQAADITHDQAARAFFPIQKGVAAWMGDTRVYRTGKPLISRELAQAFAAKLEPGDIVLARQNWFLSNIGLPGFWPHAELHLGTRDELKKFFDSDPDVVAWVKGQPGAPATLSAFLSTQFPQKWLAYGSPDEHGEPIRVMESISEGVSFTGVEHALRVDYVAALRPRLSKLERAKAIVRAFSYQGRPYDFDFNFLSDASLVCTELVFKSYEPGAGQNGLSIPLVTVAGRLTLPANEYARAFDANYGAPNAQMDFVAFLEGIEGDKAARWADAEAFRQTWKRPKWDVVQQ